MSEKEENIKQDKNKGRFLGKPIFIKKGQPKPDHNEALKRIDKILEQKK
jgi:hypothetical protein